MAEKVGGQIDRKIGGKLWKIETGELQRQLITPFVWNRPIGLVVRGCRLIK